MLSDDTKTIPTSQKRIEANRRNAARSTGPRTPEGKARARLNGLKHGLAAKVPVLPGEDPAEFQAHVAAIVGSYGPKNQVEVELLERVAATAWSLDRVSRAEVAQLSQRIREEAIEREGREQEEAIALGQRLFWDARGPWQLYPHHPHTGRKAEKRTSWSEDPADPDNPAILVCRLERTVAGCRWLHARWAELLARLEPGEVWAAPDQFKAVRLLGKQPLDAVDDPEVTQIFLATSKLSPEGDDAKAFAPVKNELRDSGLRDGKDDQSIYFRELKKRPLSKLRPADTEAAREVLRSLVDRHVARLKLILARNQEIAEADAAEAPARLAFDPSPEGDKLRRYALSAARLINQTLNTFVKIRKDLGSADPAESSVVPGPLSFEDMSAVPGPLSDASCPMPVVGGDSCVGAAEALVVGLQSEPNDEASVVPGPLSDASCPTPVVGGDSGVGGAGALDAGLQSEPNADIVAGQEPGKSPSLLRGGAAALSRRPHRQSQYDWARDATEQAWEAVVGDLFKGRSPAELKALVEGESVPRKPGQRASVRARGQKVTHTGPQRDRTQPATARNP